MHLFEPHVVSLSTGNGNGSKLDCLLGYNLLRVTIHHNTVNQGIPTRLGGGGGGGGRQYKTQHFCAAILNI